MANVEKVSDIRKELVTAITLPKCQQCGCMREALDNVAAAIATMGGQETAALNNEVATWSSQMRVVKYACLGCDYCYAAAAQNALAAAFPNVAQAPLTCDFQVGNEWPLVLGEYFVLEKGGHVALSTLGSIELAQDLAQCKPHGLAIVGKTETENIGIDKIVKNIVTNHAIQYLIVAGKDPAGHNSGQTLVALAEKGIDENGRVIGSAGRRPVLRNVSATEVSAFRQQVQIIDLIGCEDSAEIIAKIESLSPKEPTPCG